MAKKINTSFIADAIHGIKINSSLKCHSSNYTNDGEREIAYIVMHYTGNSKDTAMANANYFTGANRESSAHLFVDNAHIYQSVELRDVAWHCGTRGDYYHDKCRNTNSIGIEMCCTAGNYKISDKTKKNAAYLCAYLCKMIGITSKQVDTYVLRHYDVTHKKCPAQMVSDADEWAEFKDMVKNIIDTGSVDGAAVTKKESKINEGDLIKLASNAKYYNGKAIPSWVKKLTWYVSEVEGSRAVLNKSADGKYAINSPVDVKYLTVAKSAASASKPATAEPKIAAGKKVVLSKCPLYASSVSLFSAGKITGTYYLWDANPVKNRIRITNSKDNVGNVKQITGWIKVSSVK